MPKEVWKLFDTRNMTEVLVLCHVGHSNKLVVKGYKRSRFE